MKVVRHIEATVTATATWPKWSNAAEVGTAVDDCFSPTYHVPSGTSRAKAGSVSSDPFARKLRHGRSRERRSRRGRHHAKGTRYVGESGFIAAMLAPLASSRPHVELRRLRKAELKYHFSILSIAVESLTLTLTLTPTLKFTLTYTYTKRVG